MFDHIIPAQRARKKVVKMHHHLSVFAIVLGVTTTVIALNLSVPSFQTISVSRASTNPIAVRLIGTSEPVSIVGPLSVMPLVNLEARVTDEYVTVDGINFSLEGSYDTSGIQGLGLYIDGAQAGAPVVPDDQHMVSFHLETVHLTRGVHSFVVKISTSSAFGAATLRAVFDPYTGFTTSDGQVVRMQMPYATAPITLVDQGSLGAFVREMPDAMLLYLYSTAEDFRVQTMSFQAGIDLTGTRIDIFAGDQFLTTAQFVGAEAEARFGDVSLLALRDKNTILTLRISSDSKKGASLYLKKISATGVSSQLPFEIDPQIELIAR